MGYATQIGLEYFPDDIVIQLDETFKKELFNNISKKITLKRLSKILNVSITTILIWKKKCYKQNGKILETYIPISSIRKIITLIDEDKFGWKSFENNIISYKSRGEMNTIKKPILPIELSKELMEVAVHMMCDGCAIKYAAYYNNSKESLDEFTKKLKISFGDVEYRQLSKKNKKDFYIHFPIALTKIISKYFNIDFHSKRCRIPKQFLARNNRSELISIIRAFFIDEGTVDDGNVRLDSSNINFLKDIYSIALKLGYKCGKIWQSEGPIFRFNILSESIKQFYNDVKPVSISDKERKLIFACSVSDRVWKYNIPGFTKQVILKTLIQKPHTSLELGIKLKMHRRAINTHLRWLKNKGIVEIKGKSKYSFIFKIRDKKTAMKFIKNPQIFINRRETNDYGYTQYGTIKILNECSLKANKISQKIGITLPATLKMLNGLISKDLIRKNERKEYIITDKGKEIIKFDENVARFLLYSNVKNINKSVLEQIVFP